MKEYSSYIYTLLLLFFAGDVVGQSYPGHIPESSEMAGMAIPQQESSISKKLARSCSDTLMVSTCEGQTYLFGDQKIKKTGVYVHTFHSLAGSDSTIVACLNFRKAVHSTTSLTLCPKELPFIWNGIKIPSGAKSSADYARYTTFSTEGCDSIVTLNLHINSNKKSNTSALICSATSYQFGKQILNTSGTYTEHFTTDTGCDSISTLKLTVKPEPVVQEVSLKGDGKVWFEGKVYTASTSFNITLYDKEGCERTIRKINITVQQKTGDTLYATICRGEIYTLDGRNLSEPGVYRNTDSNVAVSWVSLKVNEAPKLQINFNRDVQYCLGSVIHMEALGAEGIEWWSGGQMLGRGNSMLVELTQRLQTIEVRGAGQNGCSSKSNVIVEAGVCCIPELPGVIKPNDPGEVTAFGPGNTDQLKTYDMWIYNSSGQEVYEAAHSQTKWNGICEDGTPAAPGVYFYALKGYCSSGKPFQARGQFMLIR